MEIFNSDSGCWKPTDLLKQPLREKMGANSSVDYTDSNHFCYKVVQLCFQCCRRNTGQFVKKDSKKIISSTAYNTQLIEASLKKERKNPSIQNTIAQIYIFPNLQCSMPVGEPFHAPQRCSSHELPS